MARNVKFALEMANGAQVRSNLEDLRKNFDMKTAVEHFQSGKLTQWLEDRYYDEEAAKVKALDKDSADLERQLCAILGVAYDNTAELDEEQIQRLEQKKELLRQKTSDESVIAHAAQTAFNQEDLADLLDMGVSTIYLCGKSFDIPIRMEGIKYIGFFGKPQVRINASSAEELQRKSIVLDNVEWENNPPSNQSSPPRETEHASVSRQQGANSQMKQAAQELLQDVQHGNYAAWQPMVFPYLETSLFGSKRQIERDLEQSARAFQAEAMDVLDDEVHLKIGVLRELQEKYDTIFQASRNEYLPITPDIRLVCDGLKDALSETKRWRPSMSLGSELVANARYDEMENDGISGIFGGTDSFLRNEIELTKIADNYYRLFERHIEQSYGGERMTAYLEAMCGNLKDIIGA